MQYSQEHLKTMVYAEFGGQTECIMGNWKIENGRAEIRILSSSVEQKFHDWAQRTSEIFFKILLENI